jgi:eukaryotic-like serine/threonine-protein kinase
MTLAAGSRLGPYEILGQIGAGGMGEVHRARDPRLGREVAIKVLPASFSADADRLRRFEQEARAAGVLNHPNITIVYDIGQHDGAPYVVQELLEGETLRAELAAGRFSPRKAIDYATQIAHGLAAAHDKGIVHRDLKPENLFVTKEGRVKILDFGLAKLTQIEGGSGPQTNLPTATAGTEPGVVMGTLGYMSPEQIKGKPADPRSDIFAFGAILYEMLAGRRAFQADSAGETMAAILKEEPPDLSVTNQSISPGLERIVRHCIEKNPERRFQSAHDLAFDLESISGTSGLSAPAATAALHARRVRGLALAGAAAAALLAGAYLAGKRASLVPTAPAAASGVHHRLTFRRGNVLYARFTADGQNVVYGAAWGDQPSEIFLARVGSPESRPLGIPGASLLSVSPSGELAILLKKLNVFGTVGTGTLARVPLGGGAPRQILDEAYAADWLPDGSQLAVLRKVEGNDVLELPAGKPVYRAPPFSLQMIRVSPDGEKAALIDNSDGPAVVTVDRAGKRTVINRDWVFIDSIAWHPSGKEIWVFGVNGGPDPAAGLFAVDLSGRRRTIARTADIEVLHDIARDGRVLVEREILFGSYDEKAERNLSWLDQSSAISLSNDGKMLLFDESGAGGGPNGTVYLRPTDGGPAVRLGEGLGCDLSPDGKWALVRGTGAGTSLLAGDSLLLVPTAAGEPRPIPLAGYRIIAAIFLPPDGKRIAFAATEPGHGPRGYVMDLPAGKPRAFTPEGLRGGGGVSPDGTRFAGVGPGRQPLVYSIDGGEPRPIPGLEPDDTPIQWGSDGDTLYVAHPGEIPQPVYRYSFATGKKTLWKEILPADRVGLVRFEFLHVTPDGRHYAYSLHRVTNSDLFVVTGWK